VNFNQIGERSLHTARSRQESLHTGYALLNSLEAHAVRLPSFDVVSRCALAVGLLSGEVSLGQVQRISPDITATAQTTQPALIQSERSVSPFIELSVSGSRGIPVDEQLRVLLGAADSDLLVSDWRGRRDLRSAISGTSSLALFIESNNKERGAQNEDLREGGYELADDLVATLSCAQLLWKARGVGLDLSKPSHLWNVCQPEKVSLLSQDELSLLARLRDGFLRTRSGSLRIEGDGRLRAHDPCDFASPIRWALGTPSLSD